MRYLSFLLPLIFTTTMAAAAQSTDPYYKSTAHGLYVGGQIGAYHNDPVPNASFDGAFFHGIGLGRVLTGFRISNYLAIEGGYTRYENNSHSGGTITSSDGTVTLLGPDHYYLSGYDLEGKLIYPTTTGFSFFAKLGASLVRQDVYNKVFASDANPIVNTNTQKIMPLIAAGISYNFTRRFAADAAYTHLQSAGNINNIDLVAVGLSYTFDFSNQNAA